MVVADIRLYREGLTRLLDSVDGIQVVATAGTGDQALDRLRGSSPDTLLVDRTVPDSLTLVSRVRAADSDIKIVILTIEEVEEEIIRCAEAGVDGYVTRNATAAELVSTIRAARAGELRCSPGAAGSLLRRVNHLAAHRHPLKLLTDREVEVLTFVERGMSNRGISESLGIEVATVKNHVHNILEKLQVKGRGEAAAVFRRGVDGARFRLRDLDPEAHP
jgi:DNA-binding NarL/FixJ family response regulator